MTEIVPGVILVDDRRCPKCHGPIFLKPCPCPFKRQGWARCARCLNPKCATVVGLERKKAGANKTRGQARRNKRRKGGLGPFGIPNQ